ncbi:MAG TPA: biotin--[acetyl-CoA-carboxylase] ligase [Fimbriimonadaceae bacterium]|jgi:BirA family biotin operon repressor/biotin-[acetyl-CoA-carboxylase] ligase
MRFQPIIHELEEVGSTQEVAAELIRIGDKRNSVVFAHEQLAGRGRFGRNWVSKRGDSLTMSLIFWQYADSNKPWLIGMACALAVAETIDCNVRWPNDISFEDRKTGGILTEIFADPFGRRVPVVGIGINLLQEHFPEDLPFATSVFKETHMAWQSLTLAKTIGGQIKALPEPRDWDNIAELWSKHDATSGKLYRMADGREGTAVQVMEDGALLCEIDGRREKVLAADAIFGNGN